MKTKLQPVRGTHDLLPEEHRQFRHILETARSTAEQFGFAQMDTPIFEASDVFHRTLGDTSDVVTKETYSFEDRGGESITLRPEFTAAIVRAFLSNSLKDHLPLKWCYAGPAFRYERPQKGRFRQFHQVGVEMLGIASSLADIEVISLAERFLKALGLANITLEINTLGDDASRQAYRDALVAYFEKHRDALSPDSQQRLERNPLRILDSKDEGDRRLIAGAPRLGEHLSAEAREFYAQVKQGLVALGIVFTENERLVRGLDYYSHTVFEFTTEALGAQNTVLAGGRYDKLVGLMGGEDTPGIGWAAGVERLMSLVDFSQLADYKPCKRPICITPIQDDAASVDAMLKAAQALRDAGHVVEFLYKGNIGKRMKRADKLNAHAVILLGEEELKRGAVMVKHLDTGTQQETALEKLTEHFK
ncbi:MAG: histidine--tRNA ligase [Rickettsiales bacterium]|nr:histidine--tRNA ligase [Rickettsiales bacterium]